jgi:3-oxoadipate enol-lactonase
MDHVKRLTVEVDVGDHLTAASVAGAGTEAAIVLVHPICLDRRVWDPLLKKAGWRARQVAYDLRGFGDAAGAPPTTGISQLANDLATVLDVLAVERADVVGLSLGGAVAQELALSHPDRVRSLTLMATTDQGSAALGARAEAVRREGPAAQVETTLERWFTPAVLERRSEAVEYARARLLSVDAAAVAAAWDAFAAFVARDRLGALTLPSQVIAGEHDPSAPPDAMRELALRIPGARFDVVPGAAHMLPLEAPQELAAALSRGPLAAWR